jgi:hypothetical protein
LEELKKIVAEEVRLNFPDYTQPFHIYTDALDYQMSAVSIYDGKTLSFFSCELDSAWRGCDAFSGKALKEFRTVISGYPIVIHRDHLNWIYDKAFCNAGVMR